MLRALLRQPTTWLLACMAVTVITWPYNHHKTPHETPSVYLCIAAPSHPCAPAPAPGGQLTDPR